MAQNTKTHYTELRRQKRNDSEGECQRVQNKFTIRNSFGVSEKELRRQKNEMAQKTENLAEKIKNL